MMRRWRVPPILLLAVLLIALRIFFPERPMDETGPHALLDSIFAIALLMGTLLLAYGVGRKILHRLAHDDLTALEAFIFYMGIGLGTLAYGVLFLAFIGWLTPLMIGLFLFIAAAWTWREWSLVLDDGLMCLTGFRQQWERLNTSQKTLLSVAVFVLIATLIHALAPPWDYDGLMYHLKAPQLFLEAGRIYLLPEIWQANGPLTTEMLFAIGLAFGSDSFAKLIHLTYAVLMMCATFAFGRRCFSNKTAWLALAILLGVPILPIWASWAYTDFAWAIYEFLSVFAIMLWILHHKRRWLIIAGVLSGFALGSKYLAFGSTTLLCLWILWHSRRHAITTILMNLTLFGVCAFIIAAPWYLKNIFLAGNPFYPFFFGGQGWDFQRLDMLMGYLRSFGTGKGVLDYLLLPFNIYVHHGKFSTLSIEIPGLLFLLALLYPFTRQGKIQNNTAVYTIFYFGVWAVGSQQTRFLLPIFPPLAILTASVLLEISRFRWGRILMMGLVGGTLVTTLAYQGLYLVQKRPIPVVFGSESKANFLRRNVFDYNAIESLNSILQPGERALMMWDGQSYYCKSKCLPDADQTRWLRLTGPDPSIETVTKTLHEMNITHLFFSQGDLVWFSKYHDPSGRHRQAAIYFQEVFREACTRDVYHDKYVSIYEITCPG